MAVRFLPAPEERRAAPDEDRADLAEVIELRSLLRGPGWGGSEQERLEAPGADGAGPGQERLEAPGADGAGPGQDRPEASGADGAGPRRADGDASSPHRRSSAAIVSELIGGPCAVEPALDDAAPEGEAEAELEECRESGVKILARRARSSGELRDELLSRDFAPDSVEQVVAEFEQSLYLDDAGLARALTEKLRDTKRASRSQIRLKLRERRLSDAVIEAAVGELDTDEEYELLREAAEERARKLGDLDRQTAERRLLGFLARRGWSGEPAMRAAREALDGAGGGRGFGRSGRRGSGSGASGRGTGVRFE